MSNPSLALDEPFIEQSKSRSGRCTEKVSMLAFLLIGSGCIVLQSGHYFLEPVNMVALNQPGMQQRVQFGRTRQQMQTVRAWQSAQPDASKAPAQHEVRGAHGSSSTMYRRDAMTAAVAATFASLGYVPHAGAAQFALADIGPGGVPCDGSSGVCGKVLFVQSSVSEVQIEYDIKGLKPGLHGIHVHKSADFSDGCTSAGGYFTLEGSESKVVGDLGSIMAGADGVARGTMSASTISLFGETNVVGRSVVVSDDLGDAGARVACGEIL
eukprot:gnl/TRDRNA2_/TRDRNA2_161012_c0_seq1.p1 gnl/TRDRNA2_/TRDRNA2_161012_c0~~gnl/TRDRNA2_/TRDRNA2_161012_c0_seq1.p1  ORF type:complete len:268 (-),score=34.22 gnl/TRDRNA2_/TRDRNA2_161012_c0_seq1:71-874(-)